MRVTQEGSTFRRESGTPAIASSAEIIFEKHARREVIERLRGSSRAELRDLAGLIDALPAQPRRTVQISHKLAVQLQGYFGEWGLRNGVLVRTSRDPAPGASIID